jgi:predicted N-acyltransferase
MKISFFTKQHPGISENVASQRVGEMGLRVASLQSIHDVDEKLWDSINAKKDLFHTHRFIRSIEDAKVENSNFWYLLFYSQETLVGTAVLSSFIVSLDLLMGGMLQKFVMILRLFLPRFLKVKILFCGLPISVGKNGLTISDPSWNEELLSLLIKEMERIARKHKIQMICFKEFPKDEDRGIDILTKFQFIRANSIPYMRMKIQWNNFQSYLAAMRHNYRRHVLRSLKKLGHSEPLIQTCSSSKMSSDKPALVRANHSVCSHQQFHSLYLEVMDHAEIKLETLNEAFFESFYKNMNQEMEVLAVVKKGQVLAAAIVTVYQNVMTFLLAGLDYSKLNENDIYFNLLYGIVLRAIQRGCTRLDLGQAPYWLKQCIGGKETPVYFYIRGERWYLHRLLKTFQSLLFPELKLKPLRAFREGAQGVPSGFPFVRENPRTAVCVDSNMYNKGENHETHTYKAENRS